MSQTAHQLIRSSTQLVATLQNKIESINEEMAGFRNVVQTAEDYGLGHNLLAEQLIVEARKLLVGLSETVSKAINVIDERKHE